jgi:2-polyprenyl-3-methyl-5-hydroxy-6-metoxy-1,4-benzoquinol methylase
LSVARQYEGVGVAAPNRLEEGSAGAGLCDRRLFAAQQSLGISDGPIYSAIVQRFVSLDMRGDVLDFGAGVGYLTKRLAALRGVRAVVGADLFEAPPDLPTSASWIRTDLNDRVPVGDSRFDGVVAAEVIEHLENPRAVARELFRVLKPGGELILSTPNTESLRSIVSLIARGHFVAFTETSYPAHITALVGADLCRILAEAGFVETQVTFTDVGGIPGRPSRTWQSLLGRWTVGKRFSDNVVVNARRPHIG